MTSKSLKIAFYNSEFVGPQNACIGLAQELKARGHSIYFITTEEYFPKYRDKFGFSVLKLVEKRDAAASGDSMKEFVKILAESGLMKGLSAFEKVKPLDDIQLMKNEWYDRLLQLDPQVKKYLDEENFDIVVADSEMLPPCIIYYNRPWVYLYCSNPIGFYDTDRLPPFLSDFPIDSDPKEWTEFQQEIEKYLFKPSRDFQRKLCEELGYPPTSGPRYVYHSPYLNCYQFPAELDYTDRFQPPENYFRVDAYFRNDPVPFELPEVIKKQMKPGDKLIYLSMGSMGSCNVELMKRFVDILGRTKYFYLVSKGKFADQYELASNMWGEAYVPQTSILQIVDLAILHGGNNGFTEALYAGIPMIIMPLFFDQFLNAQRVQECEIGFKLDPFAYKEEELLKAIGTLLTDPKYREKTGKISENMRSRRSKEKLCEKIESLVLC